MYRQRLPKKELVDFNKIEWLRKQVYMTQCELAKKIGMTLSIYQSRKRESKLCRKEIEKICRFFDVRTYFVRRL